MLICAKWSVFLNPVTIVFTNYAHNYPPYWRSRGTEGKGTDYQIWLSWQWDTSEHHSSHPGVQQVEDETEHCINRITAKNDGDK